MKFPGNREATEALTNGNNQYIERKAGPDKDLQDHLTKKTLEPHTA